MEVKVDDNKKSYYAIIPANVRYNEKICPNAKLLYGEITALCNEKGFCWASNDYFSQLYKVSKVSISKWIKQLVNEGFVKSEIIRGDNKEILNRYLTLVNDPIKEKFNTPIKEKFKENNTLINNTINRDMSSDKSDNAPPVIDTQIDIPKKQEKKETLYNTHTWNDWVKIYDRLHKGTGGGLINWKAEVRAYKDIINMLSPEITETMPLITLLFQIYRYALKNKFVKETKLDLTPNRLIKFISDVTKENDLRDHYELLKYDKDYKSFCEYFMSPEEKERFDIGEVKDE